MRRIIQYFAAIAMLASAFILLTTVITFAQSKPFAVANVHFEQNATDGDVEVVFEVKGGDYGLLELKVTSPDHRVVADISSPDASTLGLRQFRFESPEPKDVAGLKAAYPEGAYTFSGTMSDGTKLSAKSSLNHTLPTPGTFLHPAPESEDVAFAQLEVSWKPIKGLSGYIFEIENEETGNTLTVKLPADVTTFAMPPGYLKVETEYKISLGTVTANGNISFVETTFSTGGEM